MTKSNKELKKMDLAKKDQSTSPNAAPKKKFFLTSGAFFVALTALATALYSLSINQKVQNNLSHTNSQLLAQIQKLEQQQDKAQTQTEATINNTKETQALLDAQFDTLNKELHRAMSEQYYQNENWILLKTRYYLELAEINAHWSKSATATIALLQQADQLVHEFNDPTIFNLRQAIAKDIAQLQAIPKVDIVGILSQLDAAQNSLNTLNMMSTQITDKPIAHEDPVSSQSTLSIWRLRLQDSINLLNKLVVIRHNEKPIEPFISVKFEALLKENIRLDLQEAQWAVLNKNTSVYQLVLRQAITLLNNNFNKNEQNTAALINKLTELKDIALNQKRPDITSALPIINELIDQKNPMPSKPDANKKGGN